MHKGDVPLKRAKAARDSLEKAAKKANKFKALAEDMKAWEALNEAKDSWNGLS